MRKKITALILSILLLLLPIVLVTVETFANHLYKDTYYAALCKQYDRLKNIEQNKVILVGNSSVAFGMDSQLFETVYGKPMVSFGLYGLIGTKAMLDLSKKQVNTGDIVVIAPELSTLSYSLNFGAEALLKATEGRIDILSKISFNDIDKVGGCLLSYALEKNKYISEAKEIEVNGIYANNSVNIYGEICKGLRNGNILRTGYLDEPILSNFTQISQEFISYLNQYAAYCQMRGAKVYFSFSPLNKSAIKAQGISDEMLYNLYDYLQTNLSFEVISSPLDYAFDYRYFYDTNFHLNDSGVVLRTVQLVRDLNRIEENTSQISVPIPPAPQPINKTVEIDTTLNYTDSSLFEYKQEGDYLAIVGTKPEAGNMSEILVPIQVDGKYIVRIASYAFSSCTSLTQITIPIGIEEISNFAFSGCNALRSIILLENSGDNLSVYSDTFANLSRDCKIILANASKAQFITGYFWPQVTLQITERER